MTIISSNWAKSLLFGMWIISAVGSSAAQDANTPAEPPAAAQEAPPADEQPVEVAAPATGQAAPSTTRRAAAPIEEPVTADLLRGVMPDFSAQDLAWISAVIIALLALRSRPLTSLQNLDALALIAGIFLLLGRTDTSPAQEGGRTVQWWSYALLTAIAGYWLIRGVGLAFSKKGSSAAAQLPHLPLVILLVLGVGSLAYKIGVDPIAEDSLDGIAGGAYMTKSGKLPYGESLRSDEHSPLLYMANAAALQVLPPQNVGRETDSDEGYAMRVAGAPQEKLNAARLVNITLFVLTIAALAVIGIRTRCGSVAMTLMALACFLPGVRESVTHPTLMLPAALLTWTAALAFVPGVGGLLGGVTCVFAGLAAPFAWLTAPVVFAYFCRRGMQGLGCGIGILASVAAILYGIPTLVAPSLPRADRSLAAAGRAPTFALRSEDEGKTIILDSQSATSAPTGGRAARLWSMLLDRETMTLAETGMKLTSAPDLSASNVQVNNVNAEGLALRIAQQHYRGALEQAGGGARFVPGLRTILESTALSKPIKRLEAPDPWNLWSAAASAERVAQIRAGTKIAAIVVALLIAALLLRRRNPEPHNLLGAILAVSVLAALGGSAGVVWEQGWWLPLVVAVFAGVRSSSAPVAPRSAPPAPNVAPPPGPRGAAPRISVEN